jgi:hypothetical protein
MKQFFLVFVLLAVSVIVVHATDTPAFPVLSESAPAVGESIGAGVDVALTWDTESILANHTYAVSISKNPAEEIPAENLLADPLGTLPTSIDDTLLSDGDGSYYLHVRVQNTDGAGSLIGEATGTAHYGPWTLDRIDPVVSIVALTPDEEVNGEASLKYSSDVDLTPQFSVDEVKWHDAATVVVLSDIDEFEGLAEAGFTLHFRDTDEAGNIGSANIDLIKDVTAPVVAITAPADDSTVNGETAVGFTSENLNTTEVSLDGLTWQAAAGITDFSGIDQFSGPDGLITLRVRDTDSAGNIGLAEVSLTRDVTGPALQVFSPSSGAKVKGDVLIVVSSVGGQNAELSIGGEHWYDSAGVADLESFDEFVELDDGAFTLSLRDADEIGNTSVLEISLVKDVTAPILTVPAADVDVPFLSTGTDLLADVSANDAIDGVLTPIVNDGGFDPGIPAEYTVTYIAEDTAGNKSMSTRVFRVGFSLSGSVVYSGDNGSDADTIIEILFADGTFLSRVVVPNGTGAWHSFQVTDAGSYRIRAWLDRIDNTVYDEGEPRDFYSNAIVGLTAGTIGSLDMVLADWEAARQYDAGWNLISFPGLPHVDDLSEQFGSDFGGAWTWDSATQRYERAQSLAAKTGAWVFLRQSATVVIRGEATEPGPIPYVGGGWTLLGVANGVGRPADTAVWSFKAGRFQSVPAGAVLDRYRGYWLYSDSGGEIPNQ